MAWNETETALLEQRRLRAWQLHCEGVRQTQIAALLGVTQGAVSRWLARARAGGAEALRIPKPTGVPPRLPREKQQLLPALLRKGPAAFGLPGTRWTRARIAQMIQREFGVRYSEESVSYVLRNIGWKQSPLQPEPRARRSAPSPAEQRQAAGHRNAGRKQRRVSLPNGETTE